jgi:hypothetical protein
MRTGWQRRRRRGGPVLAAAWAVMPANACVLGMRGAGHRKVDARGAACAAHYFGPGGQESEGGLRGRRRPRACPTWRLELKLSGVSIQRSLRVRSTTEHGVHKAR